jgi:hypothetical protein
VWFGLASYRWQPANAHAIANRRRVVQEAATKDVTAVLEELDINVPLQFFVHARIGKPVDEILGVASDVGADLIIVGSKGLTGLERLMLGSVAERVVREAGCTVEVVRPTAYAHVDLCQVIEVERDPKSYVAPHRYSYEEKRITMRPRNWPLY